MNLRSLVPLRSRTHIARNEINPFDMLQREGVMTGF